MAPLRTFSRVSCVPAVSPWTRDSTGPGFYSTSPPLHGDLHCTCILLLIKSGTHGGSSGRERPTGITPRDLPLALPPLAGPVFHRSPVRGFLPITPSSLCAHPSAPALKRLRFRASHNQYSGHPEYRFTVTLSPHSVLRQISFSWYRLFRVLGTESIDRGTGGGRACGRGLFLGRRQLCLAPRPE